MNTWRLFQLNLLKDIWISNLNKIYKKLIFFNMSFFCDFLKLLSIDDLTDKVCCDVVLGFGVKIMANFKIETIEKDEIILKCKKEKIKVLGKDLKILSLSKGEIEISGKVDGVLKIWLELSK